MKKVQKLALPVLTAYLWIMMVLFGAIVLETFMVYPNVFADPPESLEIAMDFFSVSGPSDFFPPVGFATWVTGAGALVLCWRVKGARWWIAFSLLMIVCEGVASVLFFWPRNDIMFVEGPTVHSAEYLKQVAREFETWHWRSRMGFNAAAAVGAFVGFLRLYRHRLLSRFAPHEAYGTPDRSRFGGDHGGRPPTLPACWRTAAREAVRRHPREDRKDEG